MSHLLAGNPSFRSKLVLAITGGAAFALLIFGVANEPLLCAQSGSVNETIAYTHTAKDARDTYHPTYDIYSVNADGTNIKALTNDGNSHSPSWSPDGRQILFVQDGQTQRVNPYHQSHLPFGLYSMNRDGSGAHTIWELGAQAVFLSHAEWSPDSTMIMAGFLQSPESHPNIYLIPANGRGNARLIVRFATTPSWSPDEKKIAFSQDFAIKVMKTDGSGLVTLTDSRSAAYPAWSPDGKQIAFAMPAAADRYQIFTMDSDGSHSLQLTTDPDWGCMSPSWSPDGKRIAFTCSSACPNSSVVTPRGSPFEPAIPPCSQRIFVIYKDAPPLKLKPLIDDDAEDPEFAPVN